MLPQWHKVQMRLAGSSCISCLMELEKKLKGMKGIVKAKVEYLGDNVFYYQALPSSQAVIVYDQTLVSLETIKSFLKFQGYQAFKIVDQSGDKSARR
ncbi:MAG: heavy-metal-associated domain-containing protein [Candidatus Melainabacteria bacterium]|nr:heavy-metal-associated domain-containing protein [Candidatus Melainabacteria bacterium]